MTEVVKVQVPLICSSDGGEAAGCLVYDRRRTCAVIQSVPAAVIGALGQDLKGYFQAVLIDGTWRIGKRVKDRSW